MSLSQNIKRFRRAKGFSQEYMAESLYMNQSTYSRLENCESACHERLDHIARVLNTTVDVLRSYHISDAQNAQLVGTDTSSDLMSLPKDDIIQWQAEEIKFLRQQVTYLQAVWHQYCGGGSVIKASRKALRC
ncbi:helix-turn-helix domain-containing protein [Spirosoma soli]|uniref:Helix-turn-helix domain-containing protein n=1 Tax=Spirosoma soli TaxID=1770529 RepID=A0ABW5M8S0_9BACT